MKKLIKILAIETSCDETAAAVIGQPTTRLPARQADNRQPPVILSNVVSSQIDLHAKTGGIVPEVASRVHVEAMIPVITQALMQTQEKVVISSPEGDPLGRVEKSLTNQKISPCASLSRDDKIEQYNNAISFLQKEIDYIAVTAGPGLIGSLLVGYNAAKTIAYALNKPIIPINHIEGHIYSAFGEEFPVSSFQFPVLALTVSGGHTSLTLMKDHGKYETIGQTLDDAAGEAFDKVAKLLGLDYPGGPVISKLAEQFRSRQSSVVSRQTDNIVFPRPIINDGTFNFSFSGLKTAVLQKVIELKRSVISTPCETRVEKSSESQKISRQARDDTTEQELTEFQKMEIATAFEDAAVDVLITKSLRAIKKYGTKTFILAGGVAANKQLRSEIVRRLNDEFTDINLLIPPISLCGDNAAMIGLAAYYHIKRGDILNWKDIKVDSNLEL